MGILTIIKFPIWSPIDEGAHFNYIQILAEKKRLPILGKDFASNEVFSIADKIYPEKSPIEPEKFNPDDHNLAIQAYESFQPPLYYIVSLPFYLISKNHIHKIYYIRSFDFIIYIITIFLSFKLIDVVTKKSINTKILVLNFFLIPGLIVRNITISNSILEIPLILTLLLLVYQYQSTKKNKYIYYQGIIMGLSILTKTTLIYFAIVWLFFLINIIIKSNFNKKIILHCFLSGLLSIIIVSPWVIFNIKNYHSLTPNELALEMQRYVVNPNNQDYKITELYKYDNMFVNTILLPEEWNRHYYTNSIFQNPKELIKNIFFILPIVLIPLNMKLFKKKYLLITPILFNLTIQNIIIIFNNWPVFLGRYLYSSLIPYAIFVNLLFEKITSKKTTFYLSGIFLIICLIWWSLLYQWYLI